MPTVHQLAWRAQFRVRIGCRIGEIRSFFEEEMRMNLSAKDLILLCGIPSETFDEATAAALKTSGKVGTVRTRLRPEPFLSGVITAC